MLSFNGDTVGCWVVFSVVEVRPTLLVVLVGGVVVVIGWSGSGLGSGMSGQSPQLGIATTTQYQQLTIGVSLIRKLIWQRNVTSLFPGLNNFDFYSV